MSYVTAPKGEVGKRVTSVIRFIDAPRPGRNVVAILPGSDPKLAGEYVAIGAHNDHIELRIPPVDHDSLKVFNKYAQQQGADGEAKPLSPEQWKRVNAEIDSLHKLHGGPRPDSINNGADDDGSGTVSALEIAEAFAKGQSSRSGRCSSSGMPAKKRDSGARNTSPIIRPSRAIRSSPSSTWT